MAETKMNPKVVILVGGSSKGTRFRPLSMEIPKPLFPIANQPTLAHTVRACAAVPGVTEVLLLGFYEEKTFNDFIEKGSEEFGVRIRYLQEPYAMGTAGGLDFFRDTILEGSPSHLIIVHNDICCSFPLVDMMNFHIKKGAQFTILATRVPRDTAHQYGCLVADPVSHQVKHYNEKPRSFLSDVINCGVYVFSPAILDHIASAREALKTPGTPRYKERNPYATPSIITSPPVMVRLEQDVIMHLVPTGEVYCFETTGFWSQIKAPGAAVKCSQLYLAQFRRTDPARLVNQASIEYRVIGDVAVHSSAQIDPSAVLGPNVSVGPNVRIGKGVRVRDAILLAGVVLKNHCCVLNSIIGWNSVVGEWARIEGDANAVKDKGDAEDGILPQASEVTVFGDHVVAGPEIIVRNCIVLPHKEIARSQSDRVLL